MKKILLLFVCCSFAAISFAQKETFDIINYSAPKGWKKEVGENTITYTIINNKKNTWCQINIVKSTASKGSIEDDFKNEWQVLIIKSFNPSEAPQLNEVQEANGWKIKAGGAKFISNNNDAMAFLTTASGYDRCASIIATTNSQDYIKDIEVLLASVDLIKPEIVAAPTPTAVDDKNSIVGTWKKTGSVNPSYNDAYATSIAGYSSDQYIFNSNGTYHFISKTFGMSFAKILLVKENGTYQISGNTITITPQKSVIEAWSKKDGGDKWGSLLSSQKRTLEKATYQFTKHYFSGIQIWNLVLQNNTVTQRDGPHSNNKSFVNAWYYSPISANNPVIELPNGQNIATEAVQETKTNNTTSILGTWCITASDQSDFRMKNGIMSTIFRQYTFKENGSYTCNIKTFDPVMSSTFLGRESGTYQINGNNLTINPQKNVLEEWSKKNNADQWGKLLKTQKITLEKTTYSFSKIYIPENNEWQLILKAGNQTKRDGPFNNYEKNAWIYIITSPARPVIKLPGE
ncbi:lipocalin-like domain-containing protein [Ferruginibacter sp.]